MQLARLALALLVLIFAILRSMAQEQPDKRPSWFIFLETGKPTPDDSFARLPAVQAGKAEFLIWPQWLGKGVVK